MFDIPAAGRVDPTGNYNPGQHEQSRTPNRRKAPTPEPEKTETTEPDEILPEGPDHLGTQIDIEA